MKWFPWLLSAMLILAMWHHGCDTAEVRVVSDTVVTYDTIKQTVHTKPRLVHSYRTDTLVQYDTAYIVQDYTTSNVYQDSIVTDTLSIAITDTISRNAIQGRSVAYRLRLPTLTITNTITKTRNVSGLYIMPYGSQSYVGIGAVYVAPKWLGSVGYGTNGVQVGIGVKVLPICK